MISDALNRYYYSVVISELQMMNKKMLSSDITYNSQLYLDLIYYTEDCTASKIAKMLNISKPAVTSKVNELINMGLVEKVQSEEDKRVYFLKIKDDLAPTYRVYDLIANKAYRELSADFSKEETDTFCKILDRITDIYIGAMSNE